MSVLPRLASVLFCAVALLPSAAGAAVEVGDKPKLKFVAADGQRIDLEELRGQMVVIDFWATWCGPCMDEAEHMVKLHKDYGSKGLQMIGISLDDDKKKMLDVAKKSGFDWPHYFDGKLWENKIAKQWGVDSIPRTFIIGPDGTVLWTDHPALIDQPLAQAFRKHPPTIIKPELMAEATALLDQVQSSADQGNGFAALNAMAQLPAEARQNQTVRQRAAALEPKLLALATDLLPEAKQFSASGEYGPAAARLGAISRLFPDTPLGKQATDELATLKKDPQALAQIETFEREQAASSLLTAAKRSIDQKKQEEAYLHLASLLKQYPATPSAKEARELIRPLQRDPALVRKANDAAAGEKPKGLLSMARNYKGIGKKDEARRRFQEIVDHYPDTSFADAAKKELATME